MRKEEEDEENKEEEKGEGMAKKRKGGKRWGREGKGTIIVFLLYHE